jgi:hypothetical protein
VVPVGWWLRDVHDNMYQAQQPAVQNMKDDIYKNVSTDAVDQYNITKRNGTLIEYVCMRGWYRLLSSGEGRSPLHDLEGNRSRRLQGRPACRNDERARPS